MCKEAEIPCAIYKRAKASVSKGAVFGNFDDIVLPKINFGGNWKSELEEVVAQIQPSIQSKPLLEDGVRGPHV